MSVSGSFTNIFQSYGDNFERLPYAKVYVTDTVTGDPVTTWADYDKTVANTHPVILDNLGQAIIILDSGAVNVVLNDQYDSNIWTVNNYDVSVETVTDGAIQDFMTVLTQACQNSEEQAYASKLSAEAAAQSANDKLAEVMEFYDTVADLRNITVKQNNVYASGYHTANDGAFGSLFYKYIATDSDNSKDNGGTIIVTSSFDRYELQYSSPVNVKWFGAVGDGTTDDTSAIQSAITFCSDNQFKCYIPSGRYIISSQVTVDDYINLVGDAQPMIGKTSGNYDTELIYTGAAGTTMLKGSNIWFSFHNVVFSTDDITAHKNIFEVGTLGDYTSQTSAQSTSVINECSFTEIGGTALSLGGEVYGSITKNVFKTCGQAMAIDGQGEITGTLNHFATFANSTYGKPFIDVKNTVTKFNNNVGAFSEDYAPIFSYSGVKTIQMHQNKIEAPGRVTLSYPIIDIVDSPTLLLLGMTENNFVVSSLDDTEQANAIVNISSNTRVRKLNVKDNTFSASELSKLYSLNIMGTVDNIQTGGNFKEGNTNGLIKITERDYVNGAALHIMQGEDVAYITTTSKPFTISASQSGTVVPFGGRNYVYHHHQSFAQMIPIKMIVQASTGIGGVATFYFQLDTSKKDAVTLPGTTGDTVASSRTFGLRPEYMHTIDQVADLYRYLQYDSDADVSTTTEYTIQFTYAVMQSNASRFGRPQLTVV